MSSHFGPLFGLWWRRKRMGLMAGRGPAPKDRKHGRTPTATEWLQVPDRPFAGKRPRLPDRRTVARSVSQPLHPQTRAWWAAVSTMPHCALWSAADWRFCTTTALVADMFFCGDRVAAAELRQRERILGTTNEARRALRIRYVDEDELRPSAEPVVVSASVTSIDERRRRLSLDGSSGA